MTKDFFVQEIEEASGMLYRVAFTILKNNDTCRDALQDTALRAWERRATLRDERFFRTWITRILINVCHDTLRKQKRLLWLTDASEPSAPPPDLTLNMVLNTLPEPLRLPLILCYMEGMSYEEAAAALHLPLTTLRSRIHRAKAVLKKELNAE